jgi:hypothetical protein
MSLRGALGAPIALLFIGFGLEMKKDMASGNSQSYCPPQKKSHQTFFLSMFKQWKSHQ